MTRVAESFGVIAQMGPRVLGSVHKGFWQGFGGVAVGDTTSAIFLLARGRQKYGASRRAMPVYERRGGGSRLPRLGRARFQTHRTNRSKRQGFYVANG